MERTVESIVNNMEKVIPEHEEEVLEQLDRFKRGLVFTAPEFKHEKLYIFFNDLVPNPPEKDWHVEVISVYINEPLQNICKKFSYQMNNEKEIEM